MMSQENDLLDSEIDSEEALDPEEAVAAIAFVAMFGNGEVTEDEIDLFNDIVLSMELFEDYADDELQEVVDIIADIYYEDGMDALYKLALESLSEDLVETAFETAVEVVLVDGNIPEENEDFIGKLQQALRIEDKVAQEIIEELTAV
jgi:hypothetical protein